MFQQFTNFAGYFPLQHHDPEFEAHARILPHAHRVPVIADGEGFTIDSLTEGLMHGFHLVDTKDNEKHPRLWVSAAPAVADKTSWGAVKDAWDSTEDRLKPMAASSPLGLKFPDFYPGVVVAGADLDSQAQLVAPAWAGLVAPSFSGPIEVASAVWDVVGGALSESYAPVTSAWRIYSRPAGAIFGSAPREYLGLSWELGLGGTDATEFISGLGMVGEHGMGRSVLAAAGHKAGGPLEVGKPNDIHKVGVDPATGEPINALHLSTYTIFERPDGSGDSSLEDGGRYRPVRAAPLTVPAFWRHDSESFHNWTLGVGPGLWRWQASSFIAVIPDEPDKGKKDGFPQPRPDGTSPPTEPVIPPDNFGFPKPRPLPPEIFTTEVLPRDPKGNRKLAGTVGEIAVRGLVFRESLDWQQYQDFKWAIDSRNQIDELGHEAERSWIDAPAILRMDIAADPSTRTKSPNSRYASVGSGVAWLLPAELGLEDIVDANRNGTTPLIDYTTIGKRWLGLGRGVNLFFGNSSLNAPWAPGQGMAMEFVPAGTFFKMTTYSSSGAGTDILTLLSGGALSVIQSVAAPIVYGSNAVDTDMLNLSSEAKSLALIQTSGSWGSNRIQEFQDADGTVALLEADQEFSGEFSHTGTTIGFLGATPSAQGSAISAPTGGATQDTEARTAINSIRAVLAGFGFIAS